jgi:hypothetical protein
MSPSTVEVQAADDSLYLQEMEAVAFSCNRRAIASIRGALDASRPFTFVEYLAKEPIVSPAIDDAVRIDNTTFFFPFLRREAERAPWHKNETSPVIHDDRFWREQAKMLPRYQYPGSIHTLDGDSFAKRSWNLWSNVHQRYGECVFTSDEIAGFAENSGVRNHVGARLEYDLFGHSLVDAGLSLKAFYAPIASERLFYGYALLLFPMVRTDENIDAHRGANREPCEIGEVVANAVETIHLLTLPFLHETIYELKHRNAPRSAETAFQKVRATSVDSRTSVIAGIEDAFADLWVRRKTSNPNRENGDPAIRSLIFSRYYLASPKMVESMSDAISRCRFLRKPEKEKPLPSAIVYGEPGSGKEQMARLLAYLTDDYFDSRVNTINMAAIRPSPLAAPLLQGMEFELCPVKSLLLPPDVGNGDERPKETFILDELNSLDVEMQGVLLRIIEQGEVTPLFGREPAAVAHFMVGVVNEDPEQITHENQLEEVLRGSGGLGTVATAFLSNALRRNRRLRDDLFHRLRRGVYVRIPPIDQRREDLPFLLLFTVAGEIKDQWEAQNRVGEPKIYVDFRAYDLVSNGAISWRGNVRRVQQLSRRVARRVYESEEGGNEYYVHRNLVYECLIEEFLHEIPDIAERLSISA